MLIIYMYMYIDTIDVHVVMYSTYVFKDTHVLLRINV